MTDLHCDVAGLRLRSPIIAAASPVTGDTALVHRLEEAGVGAVALPSVFQEQLDPRTPARRRAGLDRHNGGFVRALRWTERLTAAATVPVVATLNGVGPGAWCRASAQFEEVGVDAVEVSVGMVPAATSVGPQQLEDTIVATVEQVVAATSLPVAVKLVPEMGAVAHLAARLVGVGAAALVLFGRTSMPDLDVETRRPVAVMPLSGPDALLAPLRWTAVLARRVDGSLVTSGGVHRATDVVKAILAGADAVAVASSLLRYGPEHVAVLHTGVARWMARHGVLSLDEVRGCASMAASDDPALVERIGSTTTLVDGSRAHAGRQVLQQPARVPSA